MKYEYYINLDERGEFYADVRTPDGDTVFEVKGFWPFEDGTMSHSQDTQGLRAYLVGLGVLPYGCDLVLAN